jgi:polyhydroxyalkanoate synthesis regulator phasin
MVFGSLERLILLQIGAAAATRERVQEVVNRLIEQGRMEREEGRVVVDDVMARARERSQGARSLIDASLQQGLRTAGVPDRGAYEDLVFRMEQLEHRVRLLENRPAAPPSKPSSASDTPAAAVPPPDASGTPDAPVGGIDIAPQPPRDEPDTTPGLAPRA